MEDPKSQIRSHIENGILAKLNAGNLNMFITDRYLLLFVLYSVLKAREKKENKKKLWYIPVKTIQTSSG